jgi:hypothetical protein
MAPQHQNPILVVQDDRHRDVVEPHRVVLEPAPVRRLDIHQGYPHIPVLIDRALPEHLPAHRI